MCWDLHTPDFGMGQRKAQRSPYATHATSWCVQYGLLGTALQTPYVYLRNLCVGRGGWALLLQPNKADCGAFGQPASESVNR
jgi:hypothetical protein